MPHAHKACKKKHTRRRYATFPQGKPKKKEEEEEKDSPYPRKKKGGERGIVQMRSSTIHQTKIIHTPAHLDQGL